MSYANYQKAHGEYKKLAEAAAKGDAKAKEEKAKVFQDVRNMEREAAREGVLLAGGKQVGTAPSKRELQGEYVRKFDSKSKVMLPDAKGEVRETTLQDHHKERLGHK